MPMVWAGAGVGENVANNPATINELNPDPNDLVSRVLRGD